MERKLKPIYVQQTLQAKGVRLFSPSDFQRVFGVSLRAAQEFIKDHRKDLFLKVRNGLYILRTEPLAEEAIANRLYAPSYISFEYALSRYGIIPESAIIECPCYSDCPDSVKPVCILQDKQHRIS